MPVTSASTPPTLPIVAGMTSSRSVASAAFDVSSVPLPCIGDTTSTVLSGLVLVVTGSDIWPLAARSLMASMPAWTSGLVTSSAWTATMPGSARRTRPGCGRRPSSPRGRAAARSARVGGVHAERRDAERDEDGARARTARSPGGAARGRGSSPMRDSPLRWRMRPMIGTRPFSTLSPSLERTAGSTVSDPSTAMPTTRIVPIANDLNTMLPAKNMPAIAIITVRPEMSTAWPRSPPRTRAPARTSARRRAPPSCAVDRTSSSRRRRPGPRAARPSRPTRPSGTAG